VNKKKHFKKIVGKKSCGKKKWFFLKKKRIATVPTDATNTELRKIITNSDGWQSLQTSI
jgi:hypothetical protein